MQHAGLRTIGGHDWDCRPFPRRERPGAAPGGQVDDQQGVDQRLPAAAPGAHEGAPHRRGGHRGAPGVLLGERPFLLVQRQGGQDLQVDAPAPPGLAHVLRELAGDHVEDGGPLGRRLVAELQEVAFTGSRLCLLDLDQIRAGRPSPAGGQRLPHAGHPLGVARCPSRLARLLRHGPRSLPRGGQQQQVVLKQGTTPC